jgi:hypothetical protein
VARCQGAGTTPGTAVAPVATGEGTGTKAHRLELRLTRQRRAATGATALALVALGKKVGCLPLWTCHWSHSRTMEKPKITHKMVRRMSFMTASF